MPVSAAWAEPATAAPPPDTQPLTQSAQADVLVVGWGSSYGPIGEAVRRARKLARKKAQREGAL